MPTATAASTVANDDHPDFCNPEECLADADPKKFPLMHRSKSWKLQRAGDPLIDRLVVRVVEPVFTPDEWMVEVEIFIDESDRATDTVHFPKTDVFSMTRFFFIIIEHIVYARLESGSGATGARLPDPGRADVDVNSMFSTSLGTSFTSPFGS
ncbi:hypothetical protein [Catenuloplanes indicus]|uniref:Uncharacterized protein n=1 Tax=Catenuloplanes indicus TaxID=137267 RepID=A0AAE3W051_9ACTN|nr:hypothetical protein [Catenuloplanes indicus]MDQ0367513.1 hypothetical protein [Catenuloplanes indicus]